MAIDDDFPTLEQDADLTEPLRRVAYEAGMMLGLEATRDEQAYHRRRLNRHRYWFEGYGTLVGMAVRVDSVEQPSGEPTTRLMVGPGIGIDGLGREVMIHETYCIDLGQWLAAQTETQLREGWSDPDDLLWLKVTVRHQDCPVARQPVLARKLNLSTDAVQPSRIADSVRLELRAELPPAADPRFRPWARHAPIPEVPPTLTAAEQATLDGLNGINPAAGAQLALHARLLHALDGAPDLGTDLSDEELADGAALLLARISMPTADVNAIAIDPEQISINNLVRPFVDRAGQLAWLARQA